MSLLARCWLSAPGILLCVACSGDDQVRQVSSDTESATTLVPTYHQDVAPIFNAKCTGCHQEGGIAPFSLTTYEPARERAAQIASYTAERIMPPFLIETGGACGSFDESAALSNEQIARIGEWAETGAAEGTPTGLSPRPLPVLEGGTEFALPQLEPRIQGGMLAEFDEYRCIPVEHGLVDKKFITGYEVVPGNAAIVHHVLGFIIDPNRVVDGRTNAELMQALDDATPGEIGWPCFGMAGDGIEVESMPVTWAPGQGVVNYPGGIGVSFASDRKLVVQVHYNLAGDVPAGTTDQTGVRLRLVDSVERQGIFVLDDQLLQGLAEGTPEALPPQQESVTFEWTRQGGQMGLPPDLPAEIVAVCPHMHVRGRNYLFEVDNGGGFECEGRINRWDFNWQRIYDYNQPPAFDANTRIRVTCGYDTRGETAPVLPGWGTRNEMCTIMMMIGLPPGVFL
jgi:hypothetical protein